jgi:hypothetical protein
MSSPHREHDLSENLAAFERAARISAISTEFRLNAKKVGDLW